jgi:hypothetical protein
MKPYRLKIKITKQILKDSMMCGSEFDEKTPTNCAVALAVREIFPDAGIGRTLIRPFRSTLRRYLSIELPKDATDYIRLFDSLHKTPEQRLALPEFEFEVDVSEDIISQINIEEVKEVLKNSKTLELV